MGRNQYRFGYYERKIKQEEKIAIVISARGNATDELDDILIIAKTELQTPFSKFKSYQKVLKALIFD
jgi:aspartokinase